MHVTFVLQVFFVKGSPRNKRVHLWVHCPRPKHDAENYIFAMEALAYLGSLWKVTGILFCLCCRYDLTLMERMSLAFASVWASVAVGSWMMSKEQSP